MSGDPRSASDQFNKGFYDPYGHTKTEMERIGQEHARDLFNERRRPQYETTSSIPGIVTLLILIGIPFAIWWYT